MSKYIITSAMFIFLLSACSQQPSTAEATAVVEKYLKDVGQGCATISQFERVNGSETLLLSGTKGYTIQFNAELKFDEKCYGATRDNGKTVYLVPRRKKDDFREYEFKPGDKTVFVGHRIVFGKTEKGWIGTVTDL